MKKSGAYCNLLTIAEKNFCPRVERIFYRDDITMTKTWRVFLGWWITMYVIRLKLLQSKPHGCSDILRFTARPCHRAYYQSKTLNIEFCFRRITYLYTLTFLQSNLVQLMTHLHLSICNRHLSTLQNTLLHVEQAMIWYKKRIFLHAISSSGGQVHRGVHQLWEAAHSQTLHGFTHQHHQQVKPFLLFFPWHVYM